MRLANQDEEPDDDEDEAPKKVRVAGPGVGAGSVQSRESPHLGWAEPATVRPCHFWAAHCLVRSAPVGHAAREQCFLQGCRGVSQGLTQGRGPASLSRSSSAAPQPPQPSPRPRPQRPPSRGQAEPPPRARPPEVSASSPLLPAGHVAGWAAPTEATLSTAQQQLAFLEGRKKRLLQAALQAKQKNDMEGAKMHLRQAKGLEPMLEASRNGLPVDIAKVGPSAPRAGPGSCPPGSG